MFKLFILKGAIDTVRVVVTSVWAVNSVHCRPVNSDGNSWADRVRGVQHGAPVASVNIVSEVTEAAVQSSDHTQQQSVITTPGSVMLTASHTSSLLTCSICSKVTSMTAELVRDCLCSKH